MDKDDKVSITICGDGGTGKSSLTLRLVRSQWSNEYDPTIEDSYSVTRNVDGRPYFLELTDTAGQEEYRGLFSTSNLHSDAFLLVYDITKDSTLENLNYYSDLISIETDQRLDSGAVPPVKIVAGNKCDLGGGTQGLRQVEARAGLEWARQRGCGFMETSARDMVNVEETFALIVRRVVEARRLHSGGFNFGHSSLAPGGSATAATTSGSNPHATGGGSNTRRLLNASSPPGRESSLGGLPVPLTGHAQGVTAPLTPLQEKEDMFRHHQHQYSGGGGGGGAVPMTSGSDLQGSSGFFKRPSRWTRTKNWFKRIRTWPCFSCSCSCFY